MQQELGITFVHVTHTQLEAIAVADVVVVMTHGRIEQAGTAQEIYTQPRSAYVARFMGGHNVFSGHEVALANGSARLVSDSGELYAVPMHPTSTAEETVVWFSVRRDQIELANASLDSAPTAAEPNAVCGTVQAIEYQGSYVKVTIHRSGHEDMIAHVPDRGFFPLQVHIGDPVVARWAVEDVHILRAVGGRPYDHALTASLSPT
jgi:putative spermidine/putrescine transport system ATP-binding protein